MNERLFLAINGLSHHSAFLDALMVFCAQYIPFILIAFLAYLWILGKSAGRRAAFRAGLSGGTALVLARIVGVFHYQALPSVLGLGRPLILHTSNNSFPSDHASFAFGIAMSLLFSGSTSIWPQAVLLAVLVSFARVFVGVHFPLDVLVGAVVGTSASLLIHLLRKLSDRIADRVHGVQERILSSMSRGSR
ncbi:undecaprenyl-diphosphatase [Candidatus Bipolaricaulota bacterium]|nr:undecaprenyl-diphosphatase [Candidatus Bipolaricaulota bacterium]